MERLSEPRSFVNNFKVHFKGKQTCTVVAGYLVLIFSVVLYILVATANSDVVNNFRRRFSFEPTPGSQSNVNQIPPDWTPESHLFVSDTVGALLEEIREATRLAANGSIFDLTPEGINEWRLQNPCESRVELPLVYDARKHVRKLSPNRYWDEVLDEYSKLHRTCTRRVGNITEYFFRGLTSNYSIAGCKFVIGEGTAGLGNKLLVTVSALLYAIVTKRILLMPAKTNIGDLWCEPFVGSSWLFDSDALNFPLPSSRDVNSSWKTDSGFLAGMDRMLKDPESENLVRVLKSDLAESHPPLPVLAKTLVASGPSYRQPHGWFYCKTEQKLVSQVPWVYYSGCIYTIPKLFGSPAFRSILEALFPDKMVLTRMLRSVGLPSDSVWARLKRINHAHFRQADRRVGIQVRFFRSWQYTAKEKLVTGRILDCVLKNAVLPNVTESWSQAVDTNNSTPSTVTKVFIASLYTDLYHRLTDFYLSSPAVTGEDVGVVQITNHQVQRRGVEEDTEALVEVLLLSASDDLLITPLSTFGGLSQAYGALTPWFVQYFDDDPQSRVV